MLRIVIASETQQGLQCLIAKLPPGQIDFRIVATTTDAACAEQLIATPALQTDMLLISRNMCTPAMKELAFEMDIELIVHQIEQNESDPLNKQLFSAAVLRIQHKLENKIHLAAPGKDAATDYNNKPVADKIILHAAREMHIVPISQIVHIKGENNCSIFTLADARKITVTKTLREYEMLLLAHNFYRVHKSHIININCLVRVQKGDECYVEMSDGSAIELSFRRRPEFLKLIEGLCDTQTKRKTLV
ncbi:MAG: LytTR family transcriptional regulator [Filimonas sp.]|nr:LytTR family transcriptional regulator [Filimonas sp.]